MRDPYDVLGLSRQATFDEVKAAYRRACKAKHPDMGGSQEAFVELQDAYESILTDLRRGYQPERPEPKPGHAASDADSGSRARAYRDIDDELEELRRSARAREDALRAMRSQLWEQGDRVGWARFTWRDVTRFLAEIMRSGVKGLALLCAALIGIGSVLAEANAVSAIILLGSGVGFALSQALKSDKGGMLSAGLLLFGIMTIWLPPVRQALVHYPLATISLLLCLALIFKFVQQGGTVGFLTGGILTLYVIGAIAMSTQREEQQAALQPRVDVPPKPPDVRTSVPKQLFSSDKESNPPSPPELRQLVASKGAVLKFVLGVSYHLKIRTGSTTVLVASTGRFMLDGGGCVKETSLFLPHSSTPYAESGSTLRACGSDALLRVVDVN